MINSNLKRTWAEISLDALEYNYQKIREHIGPDVKYLGVVKADAYGHGAVQIARELERLGSDYLAVSSLDEAIELRRSGIRAPILILGHTPSSMVPWLIQYGITQAAATEEIALEYSEIAVACNGTLKIHIKVDTGMSRLGVLVRGSHFTDGVDAIDRICSLPQLECEGIFTHFAVSDEGDEENIAYTKDQFTLFMSVIDTLKQRGKTFALRHCSNSGAIFHHPETHLDMVRSGIMLFGCGEAAALMGLKPVMSVKSCVSTVKTYEEGFDISYGRSFRTERESRIGVLPIGYADGLMRGLSNKLMVHTPWGEAPVCGRICMDMTMIDLTELPQVGPGCEVEIFGNNQTADDLADMLGTISYELLCIISKRVPRLYIRNQMVTERVLRILS